ncbi:MAG: isocitrate lyase/phosphoenolpyruvate mutase family protein [Granulosicoccus sp.]|nr:isocitrate lyase/phosphoenolpyruvate mutase family protein [Granulosicoccus sp.]
MNKAEQFLSMHTSGQTFIMANAWNAGSAVILEDAGFQAIATTSAGIAFSHGLPDYQGDLSFDTAIEDTKRIASAVTIPVSMDAEDGYGKTPEEVAECFRCIAETGVVGAGIEDHPGEKDRPLYDVEEAVDRVRAAREATNAFGSAFTLTARAECFLVGHADPFKESVKRANRYREAGADCLFIPGIKDIEIIQQLVEEVDGPISVVMGLYGKPVSLAELQDAGVARISIGGSLARATFGLIRTAAREMLDHGTFGYASQQIPDAELCELFSRDSS